MPFVKRNVVGDAIPNKQNDDDLTPHIAALGSADSETRWKASRALGGRPGAVSALEAALHAEQVPRVREAMMTALMRVGDEASVRALLPYLRARDAAQRGAALEALQAMPEAIMPFMPTLLEDTDSDVRILATELARNMPEADATRVLCELLEHEPHPNVCAAAIDVLAEVGTSDALPALRMCARRFAGTSFLPFAVSMAIARISGTEG
jgi:HEAT repeat protein